MGILKRKRKILENLAQRLIEKDVHRLRLFDVSEVKKAMAAAGFSVKREKIHGKTYLIGRKWRGHQKKLSRF
jgi:hypothetical protein